MVHFVTRNHPRSTSTSLILLLFLVTLIFIYILSLILLNHICLILRLRIVYLQVFLTCTVTDGEYRLRMLFTSLSATLIEWIRPWGCKNRYLYYIFFSSIQEAFVVSWQRFLSRTMVGVARQHTTFQPIDKIKRNLRFLFAFSSFVVAKRNTIYVWASHFSPLICAIGNVFHLAISLEP